PSLPDKLYLLAFNLEKDRMYRVTRLGEALRAAALTELYRDGRLVDDNGRARPADLTPPVADGGLAATVYQQVAAVPARPWSRWVSTGGGAALTLIRDRLQESGWIEIGSRRTLGLVPAAAVSLADRKTVRELNRECGRVLRGE
nr:GPP34 family phosphoprotein [Micromonospora sp. DSM 115978]